MNILYISTSFPKPNKGSTIYTDLAEELYHSGHNITVVVSEQSKNQTETSFGIERGFNVLRVVTGNYYDVSFIEKGITMLKIPYMMRKAINKYLSQATFDFVLYEAPPVTNANLVNWARAKYKCPSFLMQKDIFPQNAVDINIIKNNSILYRYFRKKEKDLYDSASYIGCMSDANIDYILKHNSTVDSDKLLLFPNTKSINTIQNVSNGIREKLSIPHDSILFLLGGNMGKPQYLNLMKEVIIKCKNFPNIFFLFIGRGTEAHVISETISNEEIKNAKLIGNLPRNEYEEILNSCDVGLITLDPNFTIPNYPSRILSYMEYSKPVLAATDTSTDFDKLIRAANCGEWVCSNNTDDFIKKILSFSDKNDLKVLGANGRRYLEKHFDVKRSVKILEEIFRKE